MSAAAVVKSLKFQVKISGSDKVYDFEKPMITIGRGPENDIPLMHDTRVSRTHAAIRFERGQLMIRNVSQKNSIFVNGIKQDECILESPSVVVIGDTQMEISYAKAHVSVAAPAVAQPRVMAYSQAQHQPAPAKVITPPAFKLPRTPIAGSSRLSFYLIFAVVIGAIIMFASQDDKKKRHLEEMRTDSEVEKAIQDSANEVQKIRDEKRRTGQDSINYKLAQEHYLKGFRDYMQGQYSRAKQSFEAALSFYPNHELAYKYKLESERKFEAFVDFNLQQGRRYSGKNNYRLCKAAFGNVMSMVKDKQSLKYREANEGFEKCSAKLGN